MASVISKDGVRLFISYAPGTGSSALEQYIRTHEDKMREKGFNVEHYPVEEFGIGSNVTRHICYDEYIKKTGDLCDYVATGIRNPFDFYFAEYNRILSKWCKFLDDPTSWIYQPSSSSTLHLALNIKKYDRFDSWFFDILMSSLKQGYMVINENHISNATHFIKKEELTQSFDQIGFDIFGVSFFEVMGEIPIVNKSDYFQRYSVHLSDSTKKLACFVFKNYLERFGYFLDEYPVKINEKKLIQGSLSKLSVNFFLARYANSIAITITIFNDQCQIMFNGCLNVQNIIQGSYDVCFSFIADLPSGEYRAEFASKEYNFYEVISFHVVSKSKNETSMDLLAYLDLRNSLL